MHILFPFSPVTRRKYVVEQFLGNLKKNSSDFITNAEAMTMSYGLTFDPVFDSSQGRRVSYSIVKVSQIMIYSQQTVVASKLNNIIVSIF